MRRLAAAVVVIRHLYRVIRNGQLRFRLETFGVYYPELPYRAPWWRVSPRGVWLLLRQAPAYAKWVVEMERLRHADGSAWWRGRRTP